MLNTLGMSDVGHLQKSNTVILNVFLAMIIKIYFKDMRHFGTLKFIKKEDLPKT